MLAKITSTTSLIKTIDIGKIAYRDAPITAPSKNEPELRSSNHPHCHIRKDKDHFSVITVSRNSSQQTE